MDRKFSESMAQVQRLEEEIAKLREEVKKSEGGKKYFENKASQFEAGKIINQNIIDAIMQSFFSFKAWKNAQIDNFIDSGNIQLILSENFILVYFSHSYKVFLTFHSPGCQRHPS